MDNVEILSQGSIEKIDTTITVKMGTKHRLADLASKGESYDDVIARLLMEVDRLGAENEQYRSRLDELDALDINVVELSKEKRREDALQLNDELTVVFSYISPPRPVGDEYRMDIQVPRYIRKGKTLKELDTDPASAAQIALALITKIINIHFDPAFTLSRKANIFDPRYWKKVCRRVGLPMSSYMSDIFPVISNYEREFSER